jgi:hypothetical protein
VSTCSNHEKNVPVTFMYIYYRTNKRKRVSCMHLYTSVSVSLGLLKTWLLVGEELTN